MPKCDSGSATIASFFELLDDLLVSLEELFADEDEDFASDEEDFSSADEELVSEEELTSDEELVSEEELATDEELVSAFLKTATYWASLFTVMVRLARAFKLSSQLLNS
jgi:hypothetical protein